MRDFRDAKTMAHTLRAALAAKGLKITISQSLELIAKAFGAADWNTLSAAIDAEALVAVKNVSPPPPSPIAEGVSGTQFSTELQSTLYRALAFANQRKHQYSTLEHLLLALTDDADASATMRACNVDLGVLKDQIANYLDNDLKKLVIDDGSASKPTAAFQRVVQRAVFHIQESGRDIVTGGQILLGLFSERESPAAWLLGHQGITRKDAANFIAHGSAKGGDASDSL
jgi:hypothetical protein